MKHLLMHVRSKNRLISKENVDDDDDDDTLFK